MFTIAVQCHNFSKRMCWMISSLMDQKDSPDIQFNVAVMNESDGAAAERFQSPDRNAYTPHLKVNVEYYTDRDRFQHRGFVRNDQLKACNTEWILFSDCDMVYHPEYFKRLADEIKKNHAKADYMLIAGRQSNPIKQANEMVNSFNDNYYPGYMLDSWEKSSKLDLHGKRNCGAGYFQLINMKHANHGGLYVDPKRNRDKAMFDKGCNPKSDVQFRKRIGEKVKLPSWFSHNEIHLNHNRDPEAGHHITEQR